jgi:plastocyanin
MRTLAGLALFLLAAAAFAADTGGIVHGVYYEAARGVMADARMLRRPGARRWVDVELAGGRRAMAQLPAHLEAKVGDEVTVQLGDPKTTVVASVLSADRVIAVGTEPQSAGVGR